MLINATLIVQIIHFFIAYLILRFLFFAPAYKEFESEKHTENRFKDTIEEVNAVIAQKEQERARTWQELQFFYQANRPEVSDSDLYFFRNVTPQLQTPQIQEQEVSRLVEQSSNDLKNKIRKMYV